MDAERISLYQAIVSQLEDDGFHGAASAVAQTTMIRTLPLRWLCPAPAPTPRLSRPTPPPAPPSVSPAPKPAPARRWQPAT